MKKMLKMIQVIGIVSLIAFITAVSCGKAGDGDNNNNNNVNNSGGNGGGGAEAKAEIVITNLAASSLGSAPVANPVKVEGTDVSMKLAAFNVNSLTPAPNLDDILTVADNTAAPPRFKVFEFVLSEASGGLVMVAPGNVASIGDFVAPAIATTVPVDNAGNEGVFLVAGAAESGFVAQGLNVYGAFMNTDATSAYAFSEAEVDPVGDAKAQFYCRAVVPEITTISPAATATLKGGQKVECFVSSYGYSSPNGTWLNNATQKSIEIAVGAVRTDGKKVSEIGITPAEFADGLSKADMAKLAGANKTDYKKFKITIVDNNAF